MCSKTTCGLKLLWRNKETTVLHTLSNDKVSVTRFKKIKPNRIPIRLKLEKKTEFGENKMEFATVFRGNGLSR